MPGAARPGEVPEADPHRDVAAAPASEHAESLRRRAEERVLPVTSLCQPRNHASGWASLTTGSTLAQKVAGIPPRPGPARRTCLDPSLDRDGTVIAFVNTSPDDPGDVWPMDANGDGQRRVTDANPWLRERDLATTRPVTAGDHDGVPVEGWVTAYDGPNGRPLVVSVHGGPHYPVGWRFCFEAQRLAAQGYA